MMARRGRWKGEAHVRGPMFATCNLWDTFVIFLPDTNFVVFLTIFFFWGGGGEGRFFFFLKKEKKKKKNGKKKKSESNEI